MPVGTNVVITPNPVTLDAQQILVRHFAPGETLEAYLRRVVPDWKGDVWEVRVSGYLVPTDMLARVRPKDGTLVEVRGVARKQVLMIVALMALTYFTFGLGTLAGGGALLAATGGGIAGTMITAAVYIGGTILINKVLGPKPPSAQAAQQNDPVYSISAARNQPRQYQPLPLLLGTMQITPDVISLPYTTYEGGDQYLGMVLTAGLNVHSIEPLYNGDTLLNSYDGVSTYLSGFAGHAEQAIPLFSNVDTVSGGELQTAGAWVQRTSSLDTIRLQVDLEGVLYDVNNKGKFSANRVTLEIQYCPAGSGAWIAGPSLYLSNDNSNTIRRTQSWGVSSGQYDVRVRCGVPTYNEGTPNDACQFSWVTLKSIQPDTADYAGISRIAIRVKATGQLNGALDEVRCVAHSAPVPVWSDGGWVVEQTSNPGAHLLAYARGFRDEADHLIAGIGLTDDQIDIPALQAFMSHCLMNGYTYDAYIKDPRNHQEMVDAIALAGMGQVTWAGGKFSVVWAAQGQPITAVANMANIKRASFEVSYTLANAADGIEYTYVDANDWQTKTLRVTAPGVTTMLNPAQVTGEGVTSEAHAAELARWHLAQSLYQYKDINFAQDLEHLSYRRLSVLSLSHDLTQWGFSGRLRAAVQTDGVVTLTLDEPVPAPTSGLAYIGLRIPGEHSYRVFPVAVFSGETTTLVLRDPWPSDVPFPGDAEDNPAHDTIWCYDFRATPGARVRVVKIQPETDLRGAQIAVVPETEEFWTYVKRGAYLPPPNLSLLNTLPLVSNVRLVDVQSSLCGLLYTDLQVMFDIVGRLDYADIYLSRLVDGEWVSLGVVATTQTNMATFSTPTAGQYRVEVRPYDIRGVVGATATSGTHVVVEGEGGTAYSAMLTNESHTVPANSAGVVSSYAGASGLFKVFSGTQDVSTSFTLSTFANPQGLVVTYVGQTYTITGGLDVGEESAQLTIRASGMGDYVGIVLDKVFSLGKSRAGTDGKNGQDAPVNAPDLTPPPTPAGFVATAATYNIMLEWSGASYSVGHGHKSTVIYGAPWPSGNAPTFASATKIGEELGTMFGHNVGTSTRWCYWIRYKTVDGVESVTPAGGANGVQATTGVIGGADLGPLSVEAAHLADESVTSKKLVVPTSGGARNSDPALLDSTAWRCIGGAINFGLEHSEAPNGRCAQMSGPFCEM